MEDVATELLTEWVDHESSAGRYSAYLARPAPVTAPMPGVVVIQEVWGVDAHIRDLAERFATAGYGALAPDPYSAGGARPPALAVDRVEAAQLSLTLFRRLSGWGCSATKPAGPRPYRACPATRAARSVRHGVLSPAERETNPFGTWVFCARVFLPADPPGLWRAGGRLGGLLPGRGAVCATGL